MFLTRKDNVETRDPNKFPTTQLALLALVRLSEPIAITSIFPYAWKLVLHLHIGDPSNASFYAGILISAFALTECISSMFWGAMSDRWGRKPILLFGCCGSILGLLTVGFSSSFWMALLGRALGGLLNGNQGVIQTMVAELVTDPGHEPKAYAVMPFVWSVGTMIGPAIGGYFAEPAVNFPDTFFQDGLFGRFPYLLLNVICSIILLAAVILGITFIEETHPDFQPGTTKRHEAYGSVRTPLLITAGATEHPPVDLRRESYGTFNAVTVDRVGVAEYRGVPGTKPKPFTQEVIMLITALGIFTYHSMSYDNLLPIFFQDPRSSYSNITTTTTSAISNPSASPFSGGLGLSLRAVGTIMFFNGISALLIQGLLFPIIATHFGIYRSFIFVTLGHPLAYIVVPLLLFLPPSTLYPGIYAVLTLRNIFGILAYPLLLILLKEASPHPSALGKINGLAASVGASCRMLASPVAGWLYSVGMKKEYTALGWWVMAGVALVGILQVGFVKRPGGEGRARVGSCVGLFRGEGWEVVVEESEEEGGSERPLLGSTGET